MSLYTVDCLNYLMFVITRSFWLFLSTAGDFMCWVSPIKYAVNLAGGRSKAAEAIGLTREELQVLLLAPESEWLITWLERLSEASGIPLQTLASGPIEVTDEREEVLWSATSKCSPTELEGQFRDRKNDVALLKAAKKRAFAPTANAACRAAKRQRLSDVQ